MSKNLISGKKKTQTSLKSNLTAGGLSLKWDASLKEAWLYELEKEPVNDERWSCIVTAAVPSKVQDLECIQIYKQCVSLGFRRAIKIIAMADVIKVLKSNNGSKSNVKTKTNHANAKSKKGKTGEQENAEKSDFNLKPPPSFFSQILDLALKYAAISDVECKLPPDLMAAVLKYLILYLKDQSRLQKKMDALEERRARERKIKAKFIRELKPYEMSEEDTILYHESGENILQLKEPIWDEPIDGPDLYIMLVDFYDLRIFPELERIKVPFLAVLEISSIGMSEVSNEASTFSLKSGGFGEKKLLIQSFWEKFKEECETLEKVQNFKNIATLEYQLNVKPIDEKSDFYKIVFDDLSWIQYSVYCIYRQHQKYLQEHTVQRLFLSLEPLDLSKCVVYNKLCDALITGEPLTPLLVLYAIVEQVVAGVPETKSMASEYQPQPTDFFSDGSEDKSGKEGKNQIVELVTPCLKCRHKKFENICEKPKEEVRDNSSPDYGEWSQGSEENNEPSVSSQNQIIRNSTSSEEEISTSSITKYVLPESLLDQALSEKNTEKNVRKEKKWKTPSLCFFGDSVFIQTYHCTPRLLDAATLVSRFLKNSDLLGVWKKYPERSPGDRAFYNFHFSFLQRISQQSEEILKLHIYFAMSMKLIGITRSYLYRGEEKEISDVSYDAVGENTKNSKIGFNKNVADALEIENNFTNFFHYTFVRNARYAERRKTVLKNETENIRSENVITDSDLLHKVLSQFEILSTSESNSAMIPSLNLKHLNNQQLYNNYNKKTPQLNGDKELMTLHSLLDCADISNITQHCFINDKECFSALIENFKYYENSEPHVMIQKLIEARRNFNMLQCSYFPPTDTVIIIMHNDFDHRGIFYSTSIKSLTTPVTFRDFHSHVYRNISYWLVEEMKEYKKYVLTLEEKAKAKKEKQDSEYLAQLKRNYCQMSDNEKKAFLETDLGIDSKLEILEKELEDLPIKPKHPYPNKLSFVSTNFSDMRVEVSSRIHEFYSKDGTEVKIQVESWLYTPLNLLRLKVKRSNLLLYYYKWLEQEEVETSFTFKTTSDIIFSFYKSDPEEEENAFNYHVTISWPTGLLIQPIIRKSTIYIKQGYLKTYRKGWYIEDEVSRCFLKNGQVLIFKEFGGFDIFCASGTKYTFSESGSASKYEITSPTGEVWEIPVKGRCKNRRNLLTTIKVLIGVDPKTLETFYKREDGVYCMLWPNGRLVTTYPDGTKITTIPEFDENEIAVEWTDEEKLFNQKMQLGQKSELSHEKVFKNRLSSNEKKNSDDDSDSNNCDRQSDNFISISCSYLIEHPKYSSVYFNPEENSIKVMMPENLNVFVYPEGNYKIQRENHFLTVYDTSVEFYMECCECRSRTTVTLNLDEDDILCKCVDFFGKVFFLLKNGRTGYEENGEGSEDMNMETSESKAEQKSSFDVFKKCSKNHNKNLALAQRCFAFERDLSGVEFLHGDTLASYSDQLPDDTFFDINADDVFNLCHTFSSPYYKVGYENWTMEYEDKNNSLPTNLKKKDLKEIGVKEVPKNIFKYPFPSQNNCGNRKQTETSKENVEMPKLVVARTVRGLSQNPNSVITELQKNISSYQEKANDIWKEYKNHKAADCRPQDNKFVKMKLNKIALALSQNFQMYPHLCTQFPSTEKDIHYFGHFINSMEEMKKHFQDSSVLLNCKQTPVPLPRNSDFPSIDEDSESS